MAKSNVQKQSIAAVLLVLWEDADVYVGRFRYSLDPSYAGRVLMDEIDEVAVDGSADEIRRILRSKKWPPRSLNFTRELGRVRRANDIANDSPSLSRSHA